MARYTTEVRTICENYAGLDEMAGGSRVNEVIEASRDKVFDFWFPVFDEAYRSVIETKILRHYYTREIGFETVGLWKLKLETRLNEVMPYFNQLYESTLLEFNPFYDVDLTVTHEGSGTDDTGQTSKYSDKVDGSSMSDTSNRREGSTAVDSTSKTDYSGNQVETPNIIVGTGNTEASASTNKETIGVQHDVTNSSDDSWKLYSETPQQTLAGIQGRNVVPGSTAASVAGSDGKYYYLTTAEEDVADHVTDTVRDERVNLNATNATVTNSGSTRTTGDTTTVENNSSTTKADGTTTVSDATTGNVTATSSSTSTRNSDTVKQAVSTEQYVTRTVGKRGGTNYAKLLRDYRSTMLNIDVEVIESLSDLFMLLW